MDHISDNPADPRIADFDKFGIAQTHRGVMLAKERYRKAYEMFEEGVRALWPAGNVPFKIQGIAGSVSRYRGRWGIFPSHMSYEAAKNDIYEKPDYRTGPSDLDVAIDHMNSEIAEAFAPLERSVYDELHVFLHAAKFRDDEGKPVPIDQILPPAGKANVSETQPALSGPEANLAMTPEQVITYFRNKGIEHPAQVSLEGLRLRKLILGQTSLHLGSGTSLLPVAEALMGLHVTALDGDPVQRAEIKTLLDKLGILKDIERIGGSFRYRLGNISILQIHEHVDHIAAINITPAFKPKTPDHTLIPELNRYGLDAGTLDVATEYERLIANIARWKSPDRGTILLSVDSRFTRWADERLADALREAQLTFESPQLVSADEIQHSIGPLSLIEITQPPAILRGAVPGSFRKNWVVGAFWEEVIRSVVAFTSGAGAYYELTRTGPTWLVLLLVPIFVAIGAAFVIPFNVWLHRTPPFSNLPQHEEKTDERIRLRWDQQAGLSLAFAGLFIISEFVNFFYFNDSVLQSLIKAGAFTAVATLITHWIYNFFAKVPASFRRGLPHAA